MTVLCNDRDPVDVTVSGVGKITLRKQCKGYSAFAFLQTNLIIKEEDKISRVRLDWDCLEELGIHFNTSDPLPTIQFKRIASHLDDLKHASYKISELEKEIKEQGWKNHQSKKHQTYSVVIYTLLSLLVIYILYEMYQLYRYLRKRFVLAESRRALTAPLGEVQTSAWFDGSGNTVNINIKTSNESLAVDQEGTPLRDLNQSEEEEARPRRPLRPRTQKSYY